MNLVQPMMIKLSTCLLFSCFCFSVYATDSRSPTDIKLDSPMIYFLFFDKCLFCFDHLQTSSFFFLLFDIFFNWIGLHLFNNYTCNPIQSKITICEEVQNVYFVFIICKQDYFFFLLFNKCLFCFDYLQTRKLKDNAFELMSPRCLPLCRYLRVLKDDWTSCGFHHLILTK